MFKNKTATPKSAAGIAFDDRNGQVVIAEFSPTGGFDIYRAIIGERRAVTLVSTDLRTTLTKGNAHTDVLSLPVTADSSEELILRAILDKTQNDPSHTLAFTRTPDDRIPVTQVETFAVTEIIKRTDEWLTQQQAEHYTQLPQTLRVETRTRAISRVWRASQTDATLEGTTAFLILTDNDYAIAFWSENTGLIYETEEPFERGANNDIKCQHARDIFTTFVAPASLAKLQLPEVANVIVSAADSYADSMLLLLKNSPPLQDKNVQPISINLDDDAQLDQPAAFAIGSLLDHESISVCNLALTPQMRLDQIDNELQVQASTATSNKARSAKLALLIPFVAVLAFVLAAALDNNVENRRLVGRINEEKAAAQKLAQANADYESSKANFAAFKSLLDNLINLRQRQPAAHQLLSDLNQRWPQDSTWYISEINVKGASVEIKGRTKNEQAITSFAKSLEFSNGLFTGILTKNNVQGNLPNTFPQQQPVTPRSDVIEFTILSAYTPLAAPGKPVPAVSQAQQQLSPQPSQPFNNMQNAPPNTAPQTGLKPPTGASALPVGPISNSPQPQPSQGTN